LVTLWPDETIVMVIEVLGGLWWANEPVRKRVERAEAVGPPGRYAARARRGRRSGPAARKFCGKERVDAPCIIRFMQNRFSN
jgi:hypothetical protein